jgi:hypothetical protein
MADTKDDGPTGATGATGDAIFVNNSGTPTIGVQAIVDEYGSTGATGATGGVSANNAAFRHWEERLTAVETGLADLERRIEDAFEHKV